MPTRMATMLATAFLMFTLEAGALAGPVQIIRIADIEKALENHPTLLRAGAELDASEADLRAAGRLADPVLGFGAGRAEALEGEETASVYEVELELDLPMPGSYRAGTRAARAHRDAAKIAYESARLASRHELSAVFWRVAFDQDRLQSLEQSLDELLRARAVVERRIESGEASPLDRPRLEVELGKLEASILAARFESEARRESLRLWLNLGEDVETRVEAELDEFPGPPNLDAILEGLEGEHLRLRQSRLEVAAAEADLSREKFNRLGGFSLRGFMEQEMDAKTYGAGISFPFPIWNRNGPSIARARADLTAARESSRRTKLELESVLRETLAELRQSHERAQSYRGRILPAAKTTADALDRMYEIGEVGILEILDAHRTLLEIESEYLETLMETRLAYLDLRTLMGENCNE